MGLWKEFRSWLNGDVLERQGVWWSGFTGKTADGGPFIHEKNALQITTVYACVRIIAETIASLPLHVYKRGTEGVKDKAFDHPLYRVLHDEANDHMTAFTFWETVAGHLLTWGNAYAEIERNGAGEIVALWPIPPESVTPEKKDGVLRYAIKMDKKPDVILPSEKVLHFRGFGYDGLVGYSPIAMAREALSFVKATEKYGSKFFTNGARPGGVLEMEGVLKDKDARDRMREGWNDIHAGPDNSHRVAILEGGTKYKPISLPPGDVQFLETRKWQKADIAQMFRVPLHMLGDLERATFSNIEHQSIEFVVHTIRPHLVRMEQELRRKLFVTKRDRDYFAEWMVDGLLRGDAKSRNEALQIQRQNGIINADEWRAIENYNPQEGGQGKKYLVNSAMIAVDQLDAIAAAKIAPKGGEPNGEGTAKPNEPGGNPQGGGGAE